MKKIIMALGSAGLIVAHALAIDEEGIDNLVAQVGSNTAHIFYNDSNQPVMLQLATAIDVPVKTITLQPKEHIFISDGDASDHSVVGMSMPGITRSSWWKDLNPYAQFGSLYVIKQDRLTGRMSYSMHYWPRYIDGQRDIIDETGRMRVQKRQ